MTIELDNEQATPISGIIFSIVIIRVGLNTKGELDWTVDHRSTRLNFVPGPKPKTGTSYISDMETGAMSTMRTIEVHVQHSFSSGLATDVENDIETKRVI